MVSSIDNSTLLFDRAPTFDQPVDRHKCRIKSLVEEERNHPSSKKKSSHKVTHGGKLAGGEQPLKKSQ